MDEYDDNEIAELDAAMTASVAHITAADVPRPETYQPAPSEDDVPSFRTIAANLYLAQLYTQISAEVSKCNVVLGIVEADVKRRNAEMRAMFEAFNTRERALRKVGSSVSEADREVHNRKICELRDGGVLLWEAYWKSAMSCKTEYKAFYKRCLDEGAAFVFSDELDVAAEESCARMMELPGRSVWEFLAFSEEKEMKDEVLAYLSRYGELPALSDYENDIKTTVDRISDPAGLIVGEHQNAKTVDARATQPSKSTTDLITALESGLTISALHPTPAPRPIPFPYTLDIHLTLTRHLTRLLPALSLALSNIEPTTRLLATTIPLPSLELLWPAPPSSYPIKTASYAAATQPIELIAVDYTQTRAAFRAATTTEAYLHSFISAIQSVWLNPDNVDIQESNAVRLLLELDPVLDGLRRIVGEGGEGEREPFRMVVPRGKRACTEFVRRVHWECYARIPRTGGQPTVVVDEAGGVLWEVKVVGGVWTSVFVDWGCWGCVFVEGGDEEEVVEGDTEEELGLDGHALEEDEAFMDVD